ncbi:HAD family hydrolase [Yoonia sp. SS1-5]|uniref:phosphoglycolate phosphatase n=1 Tax=Yoonia rhodophyticola TaxID=3137370 RepID=A0ABZ3JCI1_9RHOB
MIFDKDGTLFDFDATWAAWTKAMLQRELDGDADRIAAMADAMGFDLGSERFRNGSPVVAGTAGEIADIMLEFLPDADRDQLLHRMNTLAGDVAQVAAAPLRPLLADLRSRGLRLGVATNDAEAPALVHLDRAGIRAQFDFVAGYDSGHGGKPAPGQLHAFCDQTGLVPECCVMVGDSLHDLHAGQAAGMITIGVLTGPAPAEELAPFAAVVLPSIAAIPDWLDRR